ncbi:hypothetical protein BHYA_0428g00020 [Botrytis hyacinthi]|uniref:Uncharacterized protein n=1 Tax=Botrytis hyacinthi TaxID=278943 RepID=A0A4Z1GC35_9HELO|nr:hypothetical protein BHYA_0428g00020 [Botrytis hyacinthi]
MSKKACDLPVARGISGGVGSKQRKDIPEKSTQSAIANNYTFWLLEEIDTLCEILESHTNESRTRRGTNSIVWKSVAEEFNRRFQGRLQEKGAPKKDGKDKLLEDRYAPKRSSNSIRCLCKTESRLKSIIEAYKNAEEETDSEMDEESIQAIQVEVFEGDQSPPRMFKWKGIRYIDNNDRTEAKIRTPDKSKTIIEYISLLDEPKKEKSEDFKLGRVRFEYKPKMNWISRSSVMMLNQWRQTMLLRTSGVPLEGREAGLSFTCPWSSDEKYKLGNIIIEHMEEPSLRDRKVSGVDFVSVTKEFNDNLGLYRTKTQVEKLVADNDPRELKDDYIMEQNERKREVEAMNATAAYAFSAKKSRISSLDDDQ